MFNNQSSLKINFSFLLISLAVLLVYIVQFVFRSFDDNRLTSWQWAFQNTNAAVIFLMLLAGLITAFFISKIPIPVRSYPLFLFVTSFIAATFFWTEQEVIVDSSRYFTQAKHLELYGAAYFAKEWGRNINAWTDMPLVPFLYGLIFRIFGETRTYIQALNTTLFGLGVVLTYELGKSLWDEETGFFSGMFLLGVPYILTQVPLMLVDVPAMFFLLLAIVTFIRAIQKGTVRSMVAASISIALAFLAKYSMWLMLSVLLIILLVYIIYGTEGRTKRVEILLRGSSISLLAVLLVAPVFAYKFDVITDQMRLLIDYQKPGLSSWQESFLSTFFFQVHPLISLAALYSAYAAVKKKDLKYAVIAWLVLLVGLLQIKRIRYIIMVFPMLALMASYGIREVRGKDIKKFFAYSVCFSSLIVGFFVYLPFLQSMSTVNLKDAGSFVNSLNEVYIEVFTLLPKEPVMNPAVSVPILDLFTKKNIIYNYNGESFKQPKEIVEKSSLRFTWEYRNPLYYSGINYDPKDTAIIVISESPGDTLPEKLRQHVAGYRLTGVFKTTDDLFRYRPCVSVYQRAE
jgi:hypothetical protein